MAKVFMTCGKVCSGKSTYAKQLCARHHAMLLSVDEVMLSLFGQHAGDRHDEYVARTEQYLYAKSAELTAIGVNVVLDWGFWLREEREYARAYYGQRGIECELHYIDISDETWRQRLEQRNRAVLAGETQAYYIDDAIAAKFAAIFEPPERDEAEVWGEA